MKIVSWNYRGMGSNLKEEAMKSLVGLESSDIILIQETKMEEMDFLHKS